MTRIPIHALDDAPAGSRYALKRQSERVGRTINILGAMAHSPAVINLYDAAEQVLAEHSEVEDATWQAAIDAGWSEVELLDAYADVVRTILTNYFNHLVDTEHDLPPAPSLD